MPSILLVAAIANCAVVFGLVVAYGSVGSGIGQGFYLSIVLTALATGPEWGALAGVCALVVYVWGLAAGGHLPAGGIVSPPIEVRLVTYVAAGIVVGFVARRGRRLLGESLRILEELLALAGRDLATATLGSHGLESAIGRRLASRQPFVLLVAELDDAARKATGGRGFGRFRP